MAITASSVSAGNTVLASQYNDVVTDLIDNQGPRESQIPLAPPESERVPNWGVGDTWKSFEVDVGAEGTPRMEYAIIRGEYYSGCSVEGWLYSKRDVSVSEFATIGLYDELGGSAMTTAVTHATVSAADQVWRWYTAGPIPIPSGTTYIGLRAQMATNGDFNFAGKRLLIIK